MTVINRRHDGQILNAAYGCTWPVDTLYEGFIAVRIVHAGDTLIMQRTVHATRALAEAYLAGEETDDTPVRVKLRKAA